MNPGALGWGPVPAAAPAMLLISGDVRQWHQQSSGLPPTGFGWDCQEAVLFPGTGWICQGRGAGCEHPPGAERCRLVPAVPVFIHHILLLLPHQHVAWTLSDAGTGCR